MTNGLHERWGRETRLLVLIVFVSLAVLLVLARFRFPSATLDIAPPAPSPLANLVSRAAFQDLSEAMAVTAGRIAPRVAVVRIGPIPTPPARGTRTAPEAPAPSRLVLGLRMKPDLVVVRVPAGMMPIGVDNSTAPVVVAGADSNREIALVRLTPTRDGLADAAPESFGGFAYLGEATATVDGPTLQPIFVGRVGTRPHERWPAPLIGLGNLNVTDGALLFTIEARFVGMAILDDNGPALVPPSVIETAVAEMLSATGGAS